MYRLMQKYGKQILAVFSAFLMIAFAVPSTMRSHSGSSGEVVGTLGDEKIYGNEVQNASSAWDLLCRLSLPPQRPGEEPHPLPIDFLGEQAFLQIREHPIEFLLLQKEAQRMGVAVSKDELNRFKENLPSLFTNDAIRNEDTEFALGQILLVEEAYNRAFSAVKISRPSIMHGLADEGQSISLDAVQFTAAQYKAKVPTPTPQQLQAHFDRYADNFKGLVTAKNPFGFGYEYPNRLKLQYIAIPQATVRRSIESSRSDYEWEVESQKYYLEHTNEFATTQPVKTQPASKAAGTQPTTTASTLPTTKPFAMVKDQIKSDLVTTAAAEKTRQIQDRIISAMASDWITYHNATATTTPATLPASSVAAAYNTFDYFQKLAEQVQKDTGVLPSAVNVADKWQSGEDLGQLGAISQSFVEGSNPPASLPQYLMSSLAPFQPEEDRSSSLALHLFEPSRPLIDPSDTVYIVRVTAAEPAHKPATLAEVQDQVRDDVITEKAYDLANADAKQLLDRAKTAGLNATVDGKGVIKVGPITSRQTTQVAALNLDESSVKDFVTQAFSLLLAPTRQAASTIASSAATAPSASTAPATAPAVATAPSLEHAIGLIALPQNGRAIVAQLTNVQAEWTARSRPMEETRTALIQKYMEMAQFKKTWFDYASVTQRLNYVETKRKDQQDSSTPPAQPRAPIF